MHKLKVGITGAGGFIGSHLVPRIHAENVDTILVSGPGKNAVKFNDAITADILDSELLKRSFEGTNTIIHLAAQSSVRDSFENPMESLKINTLGTISLLNTCKDLGIKNVIIVSSAEVYGNSEFNPVSEEAPGIPLSPYGVSKVAIEQICFVYHKAYGINFIILRPFSIYGPRMSRKSIIYEIFYKMKTRRDITLFNITGIRDYCYIDDLVQAIKNILCTDLTGFKIYNVGSGIGTNSKQLAEMIQSIMKASGKISEHESSDRPKKADINCLIANIDKAKTELKWEPVTPLFEGLKTTIRSFLDEE